MTNAIAKKPEDALTQTEADSLTKWRRASDYAPLATVTAIKMYQLYLLGHTCDEIVKSNENKFSLGMVVDARMRHDWDRRRAEYIDKLYNEAGDIVKQRQMESALFLGDMLAAAHVEFGEKMQKYIQTRDPADLPANFRLDSITKYKMAIDGLMRVTGQDKKEASGAAVQVIGNNVTLQEAPNKKLDPKQSLDLLRVLEQIDSAEGKKK